MKTIKFLIPIVLLFVLTIAFSTTNKSSNSDDIALFVESDNIAYAEGGAYSCIQQTMFKCYLPGGGYIRRYIRVD